MKAVAAEQARVRSAWEGRISGCLLGKPVEVLSFKRGRAGLHAYLQQAGALPLRDYVPLIEDTLADQLARNCCRGHITRAEPDDDINYSVLALVLLEEHGTALDTADVARAWLQLLPAGTTWTAERAAYRTLLNRMSDEFVNGQPAGFELTECSDNEYCEWIGAQIRADLYGWVLPGRPELAARLARTDAGLSHRGEGVHGAAFIAALGASIPAARDLDSAIDAALEHVPSDSRTADAVNLGRDVSGKPGAVDCLHEAYAGLPPVHTINNLAVVIWALCTAKEDFGAAIGNAVAAGWDTDCNGATVGGLFGLSGAPIPDSWTKPWDGRVGVALAGMHELQIKELVERTMTVASNLCIH